MRVAPSVVLSPEERVTLLRWSRRRAHRDPLALRARVVLGAAEGGQDLEIARSLGIGRITAARWRARFLAHRLQGLEEPVGRAPRRAGIPEPRVREILRASSTPLVPGARRPSTRGLARRFGVSHTTVRRLWAESGVRPPTIEASPHRPDPVRALGPRDVVGLYLTPPDSAVALTLGPEERPTPARKEVPALARSAPFLAPAPISAGPVTHPGPTRPAARRTRELLRFLGEVEAATGRDQPIRIVASTPGLAPEEVLRGWLLRRPHLRVEWIDSAETWMVRTRRELDRMGGHTVRGGRRAGRSEASRAIGLFLASYSGSAAPFQWVASPEEVAHHGAGFRLRYDLSVTGHPGFKKFPTVRAAVSHSAAPGAPAREMARVVLRKCLRVRRGENVVVESWSETLEYANALLLEAYRLGARPLLLYQDEPTYWAAVAESPVANLARIGAPLRAAIAKADVLVTFYGPSDRERFHALPPAARFRLGEYSDTLYAAAAKAGTRAVQLALGRASLGSARMYGVDLAAWTTELVEGTAVDPELLHRRARRASRLLLAGRTVELSHPNGTHLTLGLRHRRPQVSDGRVPPAHPRAGWDLVQLPAGVVSVALDERVAEGTLRSNVPNSVGVCDTVGDVEGGRWTFAQGRLDRFSYDRGHEMFSESYGRAPSGKERPGVLSLGLNPRISMAPLLRDQEAGAVTLQIGRNDTAGGTNHVGWWAWLLLRGADLKVDGTPLIQGGRVLE
jgi:leucyl aminopeptidase (aminopeptidase T)